MLPDTGATPTAVTPETVATPTAVQMDTPTPMLPDTGATATPELVPSVEVNDQEILNGSVTVDRVQSIGPGWIIIHADEMGAPGPVIGHAAVEGISENVTVEIDLENATETLHAMLHEDEGTIGEYEFPGADLPVRVGGEIVNEPFNITGGLTEDVSEAVIEVTLLDASFQPAEITIPAGTTVEWIDTGLLPHTVTAVDGSFDSGTLQNGDTFRHTFEEPGSYPYYCQFHGTPDGSGMAGVVIVEGL